MDGRYYGPGAKIITSSRNTSHWHPFVSKIIALIFSVYAIILGSDKSC